jgi:hypothetical protein
MPDFLEKKLESEYGKGDSRVYATMNAIGAMRGNKETEKGKAMEKKHNLDHALRGLSQPGSGKKKKVVDLSGKGKLKSAVKG